MKSIMQHPWGLFIFLLLFLCFFGPALSHSQSPLVLATVDTTRTTLESPIRLSITLSGENGSVDTSNMQDFRILSQASGSSIQIVNGRVNRERTFTFTLLPLREGTLNIPPLRVLVDGKEAFSQPITVQVSKSAKPQDASADVTVTGSVNISRPFLGQQVVYTFRLFYGAQLANTNYEPPSFDGFSATQIGDQETGQTIVNGNRFQTVTISYLLVPLKTGSLTIEPAELRCDIVPSRRGSRSLFDTFFDDTFVGSSRLIPKVFRNDPVPVEVVPLPEWSGPELFSGLVGRFDLQAKLETDTVSVGESVTLSITLEGKGNLQDADTVPCQAPDVFKQYADQPETNVTLGPEGYTGKKIFRTALVPIEEGNYTLGVPPVVYFDPEAVSYRRLAVSPLSITVHQSGDPAETPTVFSALDTDDSILSLKKEKVDFTGRDILSLKTGIDALTSRESISTAWFLTLLTAPGAFFLVLFGFLHITKKDDRPMAVMTRKSRQALHAATRNTGRRDTSELLSNLYRALLYSVMARAGILGESLTREEVGKLLSANNVDEKRSAGVSELFGRLESARFGKTELSNDQQKMLLSETRQMVKGLIG